MEFSDLISFLVTVLLILLVFGNSLRKAWKRSRSPEKVQQAQTERQKNLKLMMKSLYDEDEDEMEEEIEKLEHKKPIKRRSESKKSMGHVQQPKQHKGDESKSYVKPALDPHKLTQPMASLASASPYNVQTNAYKIQKMKYRASRAVRTLNRLKSPQDMIIVREIIGPPKCHEL